MGFASDDSDEQDVPTLTPLTLELPLPVNLDMFSIQAARCDLTLSRVGKCYTYRTILGRREEVLHTTIFRLV